MKISRPVNAWLRTRQPRLFLWSMPVLLVGLGWIAFGFCQMSWRHQEIGAHYANLAERSLELKDFETARVASQRLLSLGAEPRSKWLFNLGLALAGLGRDREAAGLFGLLAPLDRPGYLHAHLFVAQSLLMKTNVSSVDIQTAETHLERALAIDPHRLDVSEFLAQIYIRTGQWELACERLREVVSERPEASLLLAVVLKTRGDSTEARSWAERAARFHREKVELSKLDLPRNRAGWAQALLLLEDYPAAVEVLEKGWSQSGDKSYPPQIGDACSAWVETLIRNKPGDLAKRIGIIQNGLKYAPQNEALLKQLVHLSRLEGAEAQTARDLLARLLAEGKSSAVIHFALGLDAWQRGQIELARKHFSLSFDAAPQMPDVANNMALILALADKPEIPRALDIIQTVLEKFPKNPNYRETRGEILVKLGRWQEAVSDLEFALPTLGSRRNTHVALAEAYRGLGSQDLALQHERLAKSIAETGR